MCKVSYPAWLDWDYKMFLIRCVKAEEHFSLILMSLLAQIFVTQCHQKVNFFFKYILDYYSSYSDISVTLCLCTERHQLKVDILFIS